MPIAPSLCSLYSVFGRSRFVRSPAGVSPVVGGGPAVISSRWRRADAANEQPPSSAASGCRAPGRPRRAAPVARPSGRPGRHKQNVGSWDRTGRARCPAVRLGRRRTNHPCPVSLTGRKWQAVVTDAIRPNRSRRRVQSSHGYGAAVADGPLLGVGPSVQAEGRAAAGVAATPRRRSHNSGSGYG